MVFIKGYTPHNKGKKCLEISKALLKFYNSEDGIIK